MGRMLLSLTLLASLAVPAAAEPLEAGNVAADAKWVMHVNFDAFRETALAEHLRKEKLDRPGAQRWFDWVESRYGIDLQSDLHGLTLYGDSYQRHHGVALLFADYDREKIIDVIKNEANYRTTEHGDHTLHTWTVGDRGHGDKDKCSHCKDKKCDHCKKHGKDNDCKDCKDGKECRHCKKDGDGHDEKDRHHNDKDGEHKDGHHAKGDHHKDGHHKHGDRNDRHHKDKDGDGKYGRHEGRYPRTLTAAFADNVVVIAAEPENVKQALDVLQGEADGLDESAELIAEHPDGTVFYGAAKDMSGLKQRGDKFPKLAILQQGKQMSLAIGERDDQAFYNVRFVAQSDEVAENIGKIVEGFKAMLQLQKETKGDLAKIAEGLQYEVDGDTVEINWTADAERVLEVLKKHHRAKHAWKDKDGHRHGHGKDDHRHGDRHKQQDRKDHHDRKDRDENRGRERDL